MDKNFSKKINANIIKIFKANNINVNKNFDILLETNKFTLRQVENIHSIMNQNNSTFKQDMILKICNIFDVTETEVLFGKEDSNILFEVLNDEELSLKDAYDFINKYYPSSKLKQKLKIDKLSFFQRNGYIEISEFEEVWDNAKNALGYSEISFDEAEFPGKVKVSDDIYYAVREKIVFEDDSPKEKIRKLITAFYPLREEFGAEVGLSKDEMSAFFSQKSMPMKEEILNNFYESFGVNYASVLGLTTEFEEELTMEETIQLFLEDAKENERVYSRVLESYRRWFLCKTCNEFDEYAFKNRGDWIKFSEENMYRGSYIRTVEVERMNSDSALFEKRPAFIVSIYGINQNYEVVPEDVKLLDLAKEYEKYGEQELADKTLKRYDELKSNEVEL